MKFTHPVWAGLASLLVCNWLGAVLNVDISVETTPTPEVTISWNSQGSNTVSVKKRLLGQTGYLSWVTVATYPADGSPPYVDAAVSAGNTYEYRVDSIGSGNRVANMVATIEAPLIDERGAVLIVVEDTWASELAAELELLELNLAADGWVVERMSWNREGQNNGADLRAAIQAAVANNPDINSLFLFGAVEMVKSGWIAPDGHAAHAHETDLFYADIDGTWTDTLNSGNYVAGDGVYDQSSYPSNIDLRTGRVTFHSMDAYKKNEVEYLRDYIHKEHAYRNRHRDVIYQNYVGDDFYLYGTNTTLKPIVGTGNWNASGSLDTIIGDESYLFAFGARTTDWAPARDGFQKGIFTACFRSHIQEFWASNNNMRAMLTQPDWGLTACWGNRPAWYMHKMAAGYPIGDSVIDTQNDLRNSSSQRNYSYFSEEFAVAYVSNNLMGDPTLRISHVEPVSNLTISRTDASNIQLNWTASPATDLIGYHIYSSNERLGPYTRLTTSPITDLFYDAPAANDEETWFQVRAVANVTVPTGVYTDQSHGRFALAYDDGSVNTPPTASDLQVAGKINTPLYFQFPGADADGDALTPILIDNPDSGQIRWWQGQPFYVSKRDTPGVDTATFVLFDGVTVSEPATISFTASEYGDTLLGWEFPNSTTTAQAPVFSMSHIASTTIAGGPGTDIISSWPGTDAYTTRSIGATLDPASNYFVWTVTPESGYRMNISRLNLGVCGNTGDSISYELRVSANGFSTYEVVPLELGNVTGRGYGGNTGTLDTADCSGVAVLQNQAQPVQFRLHWWHTGGSSTVGLGKITDPVYYDAIEDVSILGSITTDAGLPVILATATDIQTPEEGDTSIKVSLSAPPASPITLNVSYISGDTDLSVSAGATLIFDATNWNIGQTVTIAAAYDADTENGAAMFSISGGGLDALELTVSEIDAAQPPVALPEAYAVAQDTQLIVAAPGVLGNDTDANDEPLTAILVDNVSHGVLSFNSDGSFTYTPEIGFDGIDTFTYYTTDSVLDSDTVTVTLGIITSNLKVMVFEELKSLPILTYDSAQDANPAVTILGARSVTIDGNGWKMIDLTSVNITADTVLEFDFSSTYEGEIHGIGFDNDTVMSGDYTFQLYGITADWSTSHQLENYDSEAPNTKHYVVNVGAYYTGAFRYLFFVGDDDAAPLGNGTFSNIRIYNPSPASEWASAVGLDPFNNFGLSDDANGDGKPNAYYFALDMNPLTSGNREPKVAAASQDDSGSEYLTITAPFRLGATFTGGISDPVDGVIYQVVGDSDLINPFGDLSVEEVTPALDAGLPTLNDFDTTPGADWVYRTFRIATPITNGDVGFLWIDVTEAP